MSNHVSFEVSNNFLSAHKTQLVFYSHSRVKKADMEGLPQSRKVNEMNLSVMNIA